VVEELTQGAYFCFHRLETGGLWEQK
jgi:hypothetical protein